MRAGDARERRAPFRPATGNRDFDEAMSVAEVVLADGRVDIDILVGSDQWVDTRDMVEEPVTLSGGDRKVQVTFLYLLPGVGGVQHHKLHGARSVR